MSNPRSASNAWAKIKAKLATTCPAEGIVVAKKGGPRKKAAGDEDGEGTPKKAPATPRKRAAKKQDVDGEPTPTPKKRGKAAKAGMLLFTVLIFRNTDLLQQSQRSTSRLKSPMSPRKMSRWRPLRRTRPSLPIKSRKPSTHTLRFVVFPPLAATLLITL
jgi:hypothetical protein